MTEPSPCPECGADWRKTELTGNARRGAGYHVLCHTCDYHWDDPDASYIQREITRRAHQRGQI